MGERSSGRAPCRLIVSEGKKLLLRGFRLQREELVCLSQAEAEEAVGHIDASPQPATSTGSCHSNACSWRLRHILWVISSRPGQSGRCDGYILEGPELAFYKRKLDIKKKK